MISFLLPIIYLSFISLGLPDSLLGSAWPVIYPELHVPISWSGIIFMIISAGTVISSLQSDRLTKAIGAGKVTAVSVAMTALALFGFSRSHSFLSLCLWAVPYGLGAGSVDAALNNYVALHYKSSHMSWLHCMWGVGASLGPCLMSRAITHTSEWNDGYLIISILQVLLSVILICSLPLWKKPGGNVAADQQGRALSLKEILSLRGAKEVMLAFFCYCALEQTVGLWASSYLVVFRGISEETASAFASLFFIGITFGRAVNGFLTFRLTDTRLIHLGQGLILVGIILLALPISQTAALIGFVVIGVGCAPIYPCIIHSTPEHFGKEHSQAVIGVQMASAYIGTCIMPPLFGLIARHLSISLLPWYLLMIIGIQFFMYQRMLTVSEN